MSMREVIESEKHVLTPAEQKHPWMAPKWNYKLTGRLRLSIDNLPYSSGPVRGPWADGRIQIVENCLGDSAAATGKEGPSSLQETTAPSRGQFCHPLA